MIYKLRILGAINLTGCIVQNFFQHFDKIVLIGKLTKAVESVVGLKTPKTMISYGWEIFISFLDYSKTQKMFRHFKKFKKNQTVLKYLKQYDNLQKTK